MHADERNRAMSEALGQDVYHYHLHVVYVPVVEKKILWSKRCKDPALVGTVKEIKPQVSRTKKWANVPALDEAGNPMRNSKGKPILRRSYAVLQDDFYNFMLSAGYTDVQRGERGSTEEHLTVTQFKVEQEQKRLVSLQAESREKETELAALEEKTTQAEETLDEVSRKADTAQARLNALTPKLKGAEGFVEKYLGDPEKLLPEAGALEYASHYRSRKALPLVEKLKALALSLYRKLQDLRRDFRALQSKFDSVSHDRDIYKRRWEKARDENETLKAELADYDSIKQELSPVQLQAVLSRSKTRREAEQAARTAQKRPQQTRPGQDAR
jgi:predicted  nucleic acid-binding Zn-ribbon protein